MKYDNIRAFEKHLESASSIYFSSTYSIVGKEGFECKEAIDLLLRYLFPREQERSLYVYEGSSVSLDDLMTELNSMSFLVPRKAVLINQADKLKKNAQETLERYMVNPQRSSYLILNAATLSKATSFYKTIEKEGVVLELAELKPWEKEKRLVEWLNKKAATARKIVSHQVCQLLVKQTNNDQLLLSQEFEKLLCYIGDRGEITFADVESICTHAFVESVWQLGEAIFRFDTASAILISQGLLLEGQAVLPLLRQIRNQFQTGYQISLILYHGGSSSDVNQEFPYMKGQILDRHIQLAQQYEASRFKQGLLLIDEAEMQAKNSLIDDSLLVEMLIMKLSHPNHLILS